MLLRVLNLFKFLRDVLKSCRYYLKWFFRALWRVARSIGLYVAERFMMFLESMGEETGLLAVKLMVNRNLHVFERIFWLLVFVGSVYGGLLISRLQLKRYFTSPTMISVDRNYRDWIGYMPAITLCYYDHIDSYKANEFILENWNVSIVDEDYFYYMDFLYAVVNASASNYADLAKFAEDKQFDDVDLFDLIQAIDRPFEQIVNTHDGNFEIPIMSVMTERGSCYVINSAMGEVLAGSTKLTLVNFDDIKKTLNCSFGKQQCFIKVDLLESTGVIDVHSPFEISSTDTSTVALHNSDEIIASYKVLQTVASNNLRELSTDQRKCVFHDEETSDLKIYSKTICLAKCRANMAVEMCNCVPFFYSFVDGPTCNPAGFECLLDFKWPVWALHICKCPNTCVEIEYSLHTIKKSSWGSSTQEESKTDVVTSSFRWDLIPPKVRMRRDVVFSYEDLLVSFGGTLALFLGISLITVIAFAYSVTEYICEELFKLLKLFMRAVAILFIWIRDRIRVKLNPGNVRSGQQENANVKQNGTFMEKLKQRRERLMKLHWKSSDVDMLAKSGEKLDRIEETDDTSVFEFVN